MKINHIFDTYVYFNSLGLFFILKACFVEVKQFAIFYTDDLSFNAVTSQSKILLDSLNLYVASHAVDRNTATCMRTVAIGSTADVKTTWWKVDLGGTFNIYSINILFKNYDHFGEYLVDCTHYVSCFSSAGWTVVFDLVYEHL